VIPPNTGDGDGALFLLEVLMPLLLLLMEDIIVVVTDIVILCPLFFSTCYSCVIYLAVLYCCCLMMVLSIPLCVMMLQHCQPCSGGWCGLIAGRGDVITLMEV